MHRDAIKQLINWKNGAARKPLIIRGARQVGKTWLLKEFGRTEYKNCIYVNFDRNDVMKELFTGVPDTGRYLSALEAFSGESISPGSTLIIFDEIQECPAALTALKYFDEQAPEFHVAVAGSLLGVTNHEGTGFPVGKVDFMQLSPMSFFEFLTALGYDKLRAVAENCDFDLAKIFAPRFEELLKQYYFVGGMPEAVSAFVSAGQRGFAKVRSIQQKLLNGYAADFSKHAGASTAEKITALWGSLPRQLAKENKKFVYNAIKPSARAREYEEAVSWLENSGLVHKIYRIAKPRLPLKAYEDLDAFKLYLHDVGLLGALSNLSARTMLEGSSIFTEFKGALAEQYVLQQLKCYEDLSVNYWTSKSGSAEIDFIVQFDDLIIPVEVKAETNLRAKSLTGYIKNYNPEFAIKTSLANPEKNDNLYNIPLYMIGALPFLADKQR